MLIPYEQTNRNGRLLCVYTGDRTMCKQIANGLEWLFPNTEFGVSAVANSFGVFVLGRVADDTLKEIRKQVEHIESLFTEDTNASAVAT